ncbi:MAG: hypothetical protein VYD57_04470 [Pseudomonadota bacterium]|nr:hypothetical protein [Pseudomonadota bacterium]
MRPTRVLARPAIVGALRAGVVAPRPKSLAVLAERGTLGALAARAIPVLPAPKSTLARSIAVAARLSGEGTPLAPVRPALAGFAQFSWGATGLAIAAGLMVALAEASGFARAALVALPIAGAGSAMGHHSPALGRKRLGSARTRSGFATLTATGPFTLASLAALTARAKRRLAARATGARIAARPVPAIAATGTSLPAGPCASARTTPAG